MISFKSFLFLINEEVEHHASIIPLMGLSPHSHCGHAHDLGATLKGMPGSHHVGISTKADLFSPKERGEILNRQWNDKDLTVHPVKSGGETISNAFNSLPKTGKKHLHILVGADRKDFAEGLKKSLEDNKIKEMGHNSWDNITIHYPEDKERTHGMSGTKMRQAVANNDFNEYHRHLGSMFSNDEARNYFNKIQDAIQSKKLKVKR